MLKAFDLTKWLAAAALLIGVISAPSACFFAFNQPKVPERLDKFRKDS